jgi:hypothetical protein
MLPIQSRVPGLENGEENPPPLSLISPKSPAMKTALAILVIIIAVLATGCTTSAPAAPVTPVPTQAVIPSIFGTWTGTMQGYEEGIGFTDHNKKEITMVVTEQQGRIFAGYLTFGTNTSRKIPMAGVVSRDGKTFAMVEDVNGYTTREFVGNDEIQLTHIDDASHTAPPSTR